MMTPAEAAKTLVCCLLCGRAPVAAVGCVVGISDDDYGALMRLREKPIGDHETPALWFGLCREHASRGKETVARIHARISAAAESVVYQ